MISGLTPVTPLEMMRASGFRPSSAARVSLMTITAAAPSFSGQALPAVIFPSGRNTGFRPERPSTVVPGRMPSSLETTVPSGVVIGVISRSKNPRSSAAVARCWLCAANSSISWRDTFSNSATFSAVWPMAM